METQSITDQNYWITGIQPYKKTTKSQKESWTVVVDSTREDPSNVGWTTVVKRGSKIIKRRKKRVKNNESENQPSSSAGKQNVIGNVF